MAPTPFSPIAIVGRACLLPGARSPEELGRLVAEGRLAITPAPEGRWGIAKSRVMGPTNDATGDRAWSDRGGYVTDWEQHLDSRGFAVDAASIDALDPLYRWVLHVAREAMRDAGFAGDPARMGAILGNLSFPTEAMSRYAASVWLEGSSLAVGDAPDARNRFMSGLPAHLLGPALGLGGPRYCLDAACASSLYAISHACDALRDGQADWMLAGAVNRADDLFIHVGFCALQAMSKTGQSRPFHEGADGLVPSEGCAMVVLRRLDDAVRDGNRILGVIRGIGLSNDGRARGLLAPSEEGQTRAMRAAYEGGAIDPSTVSYVECHATGTPVGDATELASLDRVLGEPARRAVAAGRGPLAIGSLKANLGHLVTVAGVAGVLKILAAFEAKRLPPTPGVDRPTGALAALPFRVLDRSEPWGSMTTRRAAVSAFGFGGNNAHVVLEEWRPDDAREAIALAVRATPRIAIVGIAARVGGGMSGDDLARDWLEKRSRVRSREAGVSSAHADEVVLELSGLKFPPTDLETTLAQQTQLLAAAREAAKLAELPSGRTGVFVGMGCDAEVARWGARWRVAEQAAGASDEWIAAARDAVAPRLRASTVVGTMPNIPANRVSSQLDLGGPSHTVSAEERSGLVALALGRRALETDELDMVLVGASEVCAEPVHERAARALGITAPSGDASIVLVLEREDDARAKGHEILALLDGDEGEVTWSTAASEVERLFGRPHAAVGLLHVAVAAIELAHGSAAVASVTVETPSLFGPTERVTLQRAGAPRPFRARATAPTGPVLRLPAHPKRPTVPAASGVTGPERDTKTETKRETTMGKKAKIGSTNGHHTMARAPELPPVLGLPVAVAATRVAIAAPPAPPAQRPIPAAPPAPIVERASMTVLEQASPLGDAMSDVLMRAAEHQRRMGEMHRRFVEQQATLHTRFLEMRVAMGEMLFRGAEGIESEETALSPAPAPAPALPPTRPLSSPLPLSLPPTLPPATPSALTPTLSRSAGEGVAPSPATRLALPPKPKARGLTPNPAPRPKGPSFDREALKIHAGGKLSEIFGPLFAQQDAHAIQVRMPMEPMLLADRATGIDATPGVLGKGTVWTETDVKETSWYLHQGRMPPGIWIESGQADLFLVSYMGIDFLNQGKRAYRLLGCELTYHRSPPKIGETLSYDIHLDGHANQGDVRLMFFHYDCRIGGEPALTVRNGQAGFFTYQELDESAGILWKPEAQEIEKNARVDRPLVALEKTSLSRQDLEALASGRADLCFGKGFEITAAHVRTPSVQEGRMLLLDRVDVIDTAGGPWKRGYLKATQAVHPDDWFFPGHFHNDPCMPGTLMFDGCMQTMSIYLAALGVTLERDGWRFEPITGETYKLLCRGQVTPKSKELVYEIFVEEFHDGPVPILYADLLCTVDGLGAFHARRMGIRLVPDWPMESRTRLIAADAPVVAPGNEPGQLLQNRSGTTVARAPNGPSEGFAFDYASLVACAWGRPSAAFGKIYERFDSHRKVARLPGPPYHFMSRIADVRGPMGEAKAGASVVVDYDVPADAWYFAENGHPSMPYCVLMEAALQPCGWLASYVGCALIPEEDVLFRNLDGKATVHSEVGPSAGMLRTSAKLKSVSRAGTMIIVGFDVRCTLPSDGDRLVYTLDTVFGFFPTTAFENQAGLPISADQRALFDADVRGAIELTSRPAHLTSGTARLATPFLLMLDRITHFDAEGGKAGLGTARAEKTVDPNEWFFKAHFFQDPVQPGSLGVEAMCQLLQLTMLEKGLAEGLTAPRFEPVANGRQHVWKYRGQVVPLNHTIGCTLEVTEIVKDETGVVAIADASLWVDGKRIYDCKGLAMRIVSGDGAPPSGGESPRRDGRGVRKLSSEASASARTEEVLDPAREPWLRDHCPTWVIPALPAMSMLDRIYAAAERETGETVAEVEHLQILRWITMTEPTRIRTRVTRGTDPKRVAVTLEVFRHARNAQLSRFEAAAEAVVRLGDPEAMASVPSALTGTESAPDPYTTGQLFHGPTFRLLRSLGLGASGSTARLDASTATAPRGRLHQVLLDACTHGIPHDGLARWSDSLAKDRAAYPLRIEHAVFRGAVPTGAVRVEARLLAAGDHQARVSLVAVDESAMPRVWASLELVEVLLPKGPIGLAWPLEREAFLRDRKFVRGVSLARTGESESTLHLPDLVSSNWLPGTIQTVYGIPSAITDATDLAWRVAVADHVGQLTESHPSMVEIGEGSSRESWRAWSRHEPLARFDGTSTLTPDGITVRGTRALDLAPVQLFWRTFLETGPWPGEDLYFSLIQRFARRVRVVDPEGLRKIHGKSVLFLGNHQVGIESLLFGIVASALTGTSTLTLAKKEHKETWLGKLILHGFAYPGLSDPRVIAYFDRNDPSSLPSILQELAAMMKGSDAGVRTGKNVMIHVEGTRSLSCAQPISKMSGVFVDMALTLGCPIVPVRFVAGLPRKELTERLEYPVGMGRQDYYLGSPILPEALSALPYKERTERVLAAINALGPGHEDEAPFERDPELEGRIAMRVAESDALPAFATIRAVLETRGATDPAMQRLVESARTGAPLVLDRTPESAWLAKIAEWLFGPRGPSIEQR